MKSTDFTIEPKSAVTAEVGSRLSTFERGSTSSFAGSVRASSTRSWIRRMCSMGSSTSIGISMRAGTNAFPATWVVSPFRRLIGIAMRSSSQSTPWRRW